MTFSTLLTAATLVATTFASPLTTVPHIVHEKRFVLPTGWEKHSPLHGSTVLPMRIALAQENIEKGSEWLYEVSHPASPKYGQHWTAKEIAHAFAPR